jgi:hypothetical protein
LAPSSSCSSARRSQPCAISTRAMRASVETAEANARHCAVDADTLAPVRESRSDSFGALTHERANRNLVREQRAKRKRPAKAGRGNSAVAFLVFATLLMLSFQPARTRRSDADQAMVTRARSDHSFAAAFWRSALTRGPVSITRRHRVEAADVRPGVSASRRGPRPGGNTPRHRILPPGGRDRTIGGGLV